MLHLRPSSLGITLLTLVNISYFSYIVGVLLKNHSHKVWPLLSAKFNLAKCRLMAFKLELIVLSRKLRNNIDFGKGRGDSKMLKIPKSGRAQLWFTAPFIVMDNVSIILTLWFMAVRIFVFFGSLQFTARAALNIVWVSHLGIEWQAVGVMEHSWVWDNNCLIFGEARDIFGKSSASVLVFSSFCKTYWDYLFMKFSACPQRNTGLYRWRRNVKGVAKNKKKLFGWYIFWWQLWKHGK